MHLVVLNSEKAAADLLDKIGAVAYLAVSAEKALGTQFTSPQTPVHPPPRSSSVDQSVPQTPYTPWVRRGTPSQVT